MSESTQNLIHKLRGRGLKRKKTTARPSPSGKRREKVVAKPKKKKGHPKGINKDIFS